LKTIGATPKSCIFGKSAGFRPFSGYFGPDFPENGRPFCPQIGISTTKKSQSSDFEAFCGENGRQSGYNARLPDPQVFSSVLASRQCESGIPIQSG